MFSARIGSEVWEGTGNWYTALNDSVSPGQVGASHLKPVEQEVHDS